MNKTWLVVLVGVFFVAIAVVGSVVVTRNMDRTAAEIGSSTRGKDANGLQERQNDGSARGSSTSGSSTGGGVPPATR